MLEDIYTGTDVKLILLTSALPIHRARSGSWRFFPTPPTVSFLFTRLFIVSSWFVAVAGALSISFSSGTVEPLKPVNISWKHDVGANAPFFLEKIKLGEPGGPGQSLDSEPVDNSSAAEGTSSIVFDKPGIFEVVAIDDENLEPLFTTKVAVQSPISSISTTSTTVVQVSTSTSVASPGLGMVAAKSNVIEGHTASVAGGVAGGITGLVLLSITLTLCWRRNRHRKASLQIPYPFYDEFDGTTSGALVSRGIGPINPRAQMPQRGRDERASPRVALSRAEKKRIAASRSANGPYNEAAMRINGNATEVSDQPPTYVSRYQI